jgi:hypothetical protein
MESRWLLILSLLTILALAGPLTLAVADEWHRGLRACVARHGGSKAVALRLLAVAVLIATTVFLRPHSFPSQAMSHSGERATAAGGRR